MLVGKKEGFEPVGEGGKVLYEQNQHWVKRTYFIRYTTRGLITVRSMYGNYTTILRHEYSILFFSTLLMLRKFSCNKLKLQDNFVCSLVHKQILRFSFPFSLKAVNLNLITRISKLKLCA